jgi:hypothetical protein
LSEWLGDVNKQKPNVTKIDDNKILVTPTVPENSYEAIRKIGTNAIPFLLKEISESAELQKKVDDGDDSYETRMRLYNISLAFQILGPIAKPAVPKLLTMLTNSTNFGLAAFALSQIDPKIAVTVLTQALTNNNIQIRIIAAYGFYTVISNADVAMAVPNLIQCLKYQSPERDLGRLKGFTADTLGDIHARPDIAVPALVETLTNTNNVWGIRAASAHALGQFGNAAASAVPTLEQATNDSNESLRFEAVAALKQIQTPSP